VADELGWAKVYDAQYVALAQMLGCRLVSVDERLLRGVARLGVAVRPREL
jgi:predicted nucleic acid-binding protein